MSAGIDLENVCCDFGTFRAVDNANVSIKPGEFFSFLGPSGCGKTTILRMVSGFIEPTEGAIKIVNGKAVLSADNLCDGLGACLGDCPRDAINRVRAVRRGAIETLEQERYVMSQATKLAP